MHVMLKSLRVVILCVVCSCSLFGYFFESYPTDLSPPPYRREPNASKGVAGMEEGTGEDGWEALHPGLMDTAWKAVARRFMQDFQVKKGVRQARMILLPWSFERCIACSVCTLEQ